MSTEDPEDWPPDDYTEEMGVCQYLSEPHEQSGWWQGHVAARPGREPEPMMKHHPDPPCSHDPMQTQRYLTDKELYALPVMCVHRWPRRWCMVCNRVLVHW